MARIPEWLRSGIKHGDEGSSVGATLKKYGLNTVCRQAHCPNIGHCYSLGTATFLILGKVCTRNCAYCAVDKAPGSTLALDADEPARVADAVAELGLRYVVITSVTRDDLQDGGAGIYCRTVERIRRESPGVRIELLIPDFAGNWDAVRAVAAAAPDVLNHNIETVKRLFSAVRPIADYERSLRLLALLSHEYPSVPLKSGLMLGMGETREDLLDALGSLLESGVSILTLGQYLAPTTRHWPVDRYLHPDEFEELRLIALEMGFATVASGPLVRSSFHAELLAGKNS